MSNLNLAFYTYFFGSNNNPAFAIPIIDNLKYRLIPWILLQLSYQIFMNCYPL